MKTSWQQEGLRESWGTHLLCYRVGLLAWGFPRLLFSVRARGDGTKNFFSSLAQHPPLFLEGEGAKTIWVRFVTSNYYEISGVT